MQKLIIKNKYQNTDRMNILTAAGIAQINEPIFPQNGARIWGCLGVVTFNQASQHNEEENPDAPITPPDCLNCGSGIPPIDPPPLEPEVVKECLSTCSKNQFIVYFYKPSGSYDDDLEGSFNTYGEALEYLIEICTSQKFKQPFLDAQQARLDGYNRETVNYVEELVNFDTWSARTATINFRECYNATRYSDGTKQYQLAGYERYTYTSPIYNFMEWYGIINFKRTDKNTGQVTNLKNYWRMGYIYFDYRYACTVCYPNTSCY